MAPKWKKRWRREHTAGRLVSIGLCHHSKRPRETVPTRQIPESLRILWLTYSSTRKHELHSSPLLAALAETLVCACEESPPPAPIFTATCLHTPSSSSSAEAVLSSLFPQPTSASRQVLYTRACASWAGKPGTLRHPLALQLHIWFVHSAPATLAVLFPPTSQAISKLHRLLHNCLPILLPTHSQPPPIQSSNAFPFTSPVNGFPQSSLTEAQEYFRSLLSILLPPAVCLLRTITKVINVHCLCNYDNSSKYIPGQTVYPPPNGILNF